MNNLEDLLRQAHLACPPDHLDRRIEALLLEAAVAARRGRWRRMPTWMAAAACVACAALGYGMALAMNGSPKGPTEQVMYIVQGGSGHGNVFDVPARMQPAAERKWGRAYVIEYQDSGDADNEGNQST